MLQLSVVVAAKGCWCSHCCSLLYNWMYQNLVKASCRPSLYFDSNTIFPSMPQGSPVITSTINAHGPAFSCFVGHSWRNIEAFLLSPTLVQAPDSAQSCRKNCTRKFCWTIKLGSCTVKLGSCTLTRLLCNETRLFYIEIGLVCTETLFL